MPSSTPPSLPELLAHTRWVENLARSLVRDPAIAADLAQSTLLVALERELPQEDPRPWLARVLRNQVSEWFRRESSRPAVESRGARDERLPGADELAARAESERALVAAVLALEEPSRSTLLLRYFEGLSPQEIARRSGTPLPTITSRITRAHAALRARLGGDDDARGKWLLALTPILGIRSSEVPLAPPILTSQTAGLALMSTATKTVILVALGGALLWLVPKMLAQREEPVASAPPSESARTEAPVVAPEVSAPPVAEERQAVVTAKEAPPAPPPPVAAPTTGGRIHGQVFRPNGEVAPKRKIRMLLNGKPPEKNVITDEEGRFDERELGAGAWAISTWPDKDELAALGKTPQETLDGFVYIAQRTIDLADGGEVELVLGKPSPNAVRVHGRVLKAGEPAAGFISWVPDGKDAMDRVQPSVATKEKGYEVLLENPGRYAVVVNHDSVPVEFLVEVPSGAEFVRDFEIPALELKGRVTSAAGSPVVGAKVHLTPRGGLNPRHPLAAVASTKTSDAEGNFVFKYLAPARYSLGVSSGGVGEAKDPVGARAIAIDLTGGVPPEDLRIELAGGSRVKGNVLNMVGTGTIAMVYVFDAAGEPLNPISGLGCKKDGTFELFALAPGSYSAITARGVHWSEVVKFEVPVQGDPEELELELKPCSNLVVDIDGYQPAWIDVRADGACLSALFDKHVFDRTILRDWSTSSFTYRVPAGSFQVSVVGPAGPLAQKNVVVLAGETVTADM